MKKIILIIALLSVIISMRAQKNKTTEDSILLEFQEMKSNFSESPNEWIFTRIINLDGMTKDDIYVKSLEILATAYKDSKEVIQTKDKEAGIIVGKGLFVSDIRKVDVFTTTKKECYHIVKIEVKEGRCRITFTINTIFAGYYGGNAKIENEHKLSEFYPYWNDCKPKRRELSFDNLRFVYNASLNMLDYIEKELNKKEEEW